jgi:hypothetical protein
VKLRTKGYAKTSLLLPDYASRPWECQLSRNKPSPCSSRKAGTVARNECFHSRVIPKGSPCITLPTRSLIDESLLAPEPSCNHRSLDPHSYRQTAKPGHSSEGSCSQTTASMGRPSYACLTAARCVPVSR